MQQKKQDVSIVAILAALVAICILAVFSRSVQSAELPAREQGYHNETAIRMPGFDRSSLSISRIDYLQ